MNTIRHHKTIEQIVLDPLRKPHGTTASDEVKAVRPLPPSLEDEKPRLEATPCDCEASMTGLEKFFDVLPWLLIGALAGTGWTLAVLTLISKGQP